MCGIFGYVGTKPCASLILDGLKALEYRGYDSAGIATLSSDKKISFIKKKGKVSSLDALLSDLPESNTIGLGHTRWATHGFVSDKNAHPHVDGGFALVHNGIIDNYLELKQSLIQEGESFETETDTEVVLKLIKKNFQKFGTVEESLCKTILSLKGSFALGLLHVEEPDTFYLVRRKSPIIIGLGKDENFFGSDLTALAPHTNTFLFVEDSQFAKIKKNSVDVRDFYNRSVKLAPVSLPNFQLSKNSKGSYEHFMLKEIFEQKEIVSSHIQEFYDLEARIIRNLGVELSSLDFTKFNQVILVGCGSAYYAACAAQYTLEEHFRVPISVCLSSEFSQRSFYVNEKTLFLAISQSGETADTLASAELAKKQGCYIIAVCNTPYSSLTRLANFTLYIRSGTEIGVAATKTFTATILSLLSFSYFSAQKLGTLKKEAFDSFLDSLQKLPSLVDEVLQNKDSYQKIAKSYSHYPNFLFMGRGHFYPIALEGSLKLKEISYCHAEGYAGGELKHGPISLITPKLPVVALCPRNSNFYKKMLSNMEEVAARKGKIIGVSSKNNPDLSKICSDIIDCPEVSEPLLQALLMNVSLQFFAYFVALDLERNIDQPRNLAKSVTVE